MRNFLMCCTLTGVATKESPFFLLYGRDPRPPTEPALTPIEDRSEIDIDTYKSEVHERLASAWDLARAQVEKAQHKQNKQDTRVTLDSRLEIEFLYTCQQSYEENHISLRDHSEDRIALSNSLKWS